MIFREFNELLRKSVARLTQGESFLFVTDVSKEEMWETYLESFPEWSNKIFRERREYDCSCCRHFIRDLGNVVSIRDNKLVSIWDFEVPESQYTPVVKALSELVKSRAIKNVFLPISRSFGTVSNRECMDNMVHTWYHLSADVDKSVQVFKKDAINEKRGLMRDSRNVLQRSFLELRLEAIDTVLELISQKSLYKGEEWKKPLDLFRKLYRGYHALSDEKEQENYCWAESLRAGDAISKIKNHSIGVLLTDISGGIELDEAVKRYEKIVAPTNYKRPKAIFTKKMVEQARATVQELGLEGSLGRRFATLKDITVNNILFANRDAAKRMRGDAFDDLAESIPDKMKNFDRVEEVSIETFVSDIIPNAKEIEVFLENKHSQNMVSLIAAKDMESPSLFKWSNNFSWAYSGNITDSMKERVKAAGGKVEGVLRFSIQWNDNGDCRDDLDAHCYEPGGRTNIFFQNKGLRHPSSGMLDVDIVNPGSNVAVENIIWTDKDRMPDGKYMLKVHNYNSRGGKSGFAAEVEFDGKIYSFCHPNPLRQGQYVEVAEVTLRNGEFSIREILQSEASSRDIWELPSNKFHPVLACMYSPNYWDGQVGIGHRHCFFLLKGCKSDESPSGFFNEFLKEDFMKHKRVFEALGAKMRVDDSDDQLSGLGFSMTKRASLVCKVKGSFERVIKLVF